MALLDDLNTPLAIAELHQLVKNQDYKRFLSSANFLGLLLPEQIEDSASKIAEIEDDYAKLINSLINDRETARKEKDYKKSDAIRAQLEKAGVIINDTSTGTTWDLKPGFDSNCLKERT